MTIRETIDGLMASKSDQESFQNDRSSFLDEHDLGHVPTELIDTAFVHYADTTSIENADALAPLVTRVGPVPFEETDLPDGVTDELGEGDPPDPWSMLTFDATTEHLDDDAEIDPADLDDTSAPQVVDDTDEDAGNGPEFGAGETSIGDGFGDDDTSDDPFFDDGMDEYESAAAPVATELTTAPETAETDYSADVESFGDFEDIGEEIDPMDLDFDE